MKKIGIFTFHRAKNYGAVLQAYALQHFVRNLGYQCNIVDYTTNECDLKFDIKKKSIKEKFLYPKYNQERDTKFKNFVDEYLTLSKQRSHRKNEVEEIVKQYDICIAGSDQIWNPEFLRQNITTEVYFLHLDNITKRIAYAPSIGDTSATQLKKYKNIIERFDYIWMREQTVASNMQTFIEKEVGYIPDPVFLLTKEQWSLLAHKQYKKDPYIFFYIVRQDNVSISMAKAIAKKLKMKLVIVSYHERYWGKDIINCCNAGPIDFLNIIKNASLVLTTSFHATAFSIILEKPFYCVIQKEQDYRLSDLMKLFEINDRILSNNKDIEKIDLVDMNYSKIKKIYQRENKRAIQMLKDAIESL